MREGGGGEAASKIRGADDSNLLSGNAVYEVLQALHLK
jgi:hypothetical protein